MAAAADEPASRIPPDALMIPTQAPRQFHREGWVYEEKVDGWRILAGATRLDVLVAELVLGGMTGLELVAHRSVMRARGTACGRHRGQRPSELRAEALRSAACLEKPVEPLELIREIARHARSAAS